MVNNDGVVVGTISEKDFLTSESGLYLPTYIQLLSGMDYIQGGSKNLPHVVDQIVNSTAKDIMNHDVVFAHPETTLEQLAAMFAETGANPIPVTDNDSKLVGIVSRGELIKMFSPALLSKHYVPESRKGRIIDDQVKFTQKHFNSNFAYVAKARANIWLTAIVVLFIVGFVAGIIYVANPDIFVRRESTTQRK